MRLRIYQPDNGLASAAVRIFFNDSLIGALGPGEIIDKSIPHDVHYPHKISADCGLLHAAIHGHGDAALQVHWNVRDQKMELRPVDANIDLYIVGKKGSEVMDN